MARSRTTKFFGSSNLDQVYVSIMPSHKFEAVTVGLHALKSVSKFDDFGKV